MTVLVYTAAASWLLFVLWYQVRARWWRAPAGWNVMAVSVALVCLLGLAVVARVWPDADWHEAARNLVYGGLTFLGIQRIVQLERAQRSRSRARIPRYGDTGEGAGRADRPTKGL